MTSAVFELTIGTTIVLISSTITFHVRKRSLDFEKTNREIPFAASSVSQLQVSDLQESIASLHDESATTESLAHGCPQDTNQLADLSSSSVALVLGLIISRYLPLDGATGNPGYEIRVGESESRAILTGKSQEHCGLVLSDPCSAQSIRERSIVLTNCWA